jgi:hypothetical protein
MVSRANNGLLLNPVAGYLLAAIVLGKPLTWYAVIATENLRSLKIRGILL